MLRYQGNLGQAKYYFEWALAIYQERPYSQHVNVTSAFKSLGNVLRDQGDVGQAEGYFDRALAIYDECLGSQHLRLRDVIPFETNFEIVRTLPAAI